MSPSVSQEGCRNVNVSIGIDLSKLKVSPSILTVAIGDTVSFRNIARGSALSSIGVFLKIKQFSDDDDLDSERMTVWEVDYLPPGDPLEWRATSLGEFCFQSDSYPFLQGYIRVEEPAPLTLTFGQQLMADITSIQPKSQQGKPLVKPHALALGYGSLKDNEATTSTPVESREELDRDASTGLEVQKETSEVSIDDIPYQPLEGGPEPDLVDCTDRLLKEYELIKSKEEQSLRPPSTKWGTRKAQSHSDPQAKTFNFVEMDLDSATVIGNKFIDSVSLPLKLNESESHRYREEYSTKFEEKPSSSASSSQFRSVPKVKCACNKEFSSSLNQKRCQTLHLGLDHSDGAGDRGRKTKSGNKRKEAERQHSQDLLDLKDFWKQTMHIDERAKILSLETSEQHRKMSSSLIVVSLLDLIANEWSSSPSSDPLGL